MPGYDSYQQNVPYPKLSDSPNIESAMSALVNAVVPLTNMSFANANARNAAITKPVAGMETWLVAEARKERYTGTAWTNVTPGQWIPFPFATGYTARAGSPGYRLVNGSVEMRGQVQRSDKSTFVSNGATGYLLGTLPTGFRPTYSPYYICAQELATNYYCRIGISSDGNVYAFVPSGGDPHWVGFDGISFSTS